MAGPATCPPGKGRLALVFLAVLFLSISSAVAFLPFRAPIVPSSSLRARTTSPTHFCSGVAGHKGVRCGGIKMEVSSTALRLQAAELGSRLKGSNIYLVGMMGVGKSTVACTLAKVLVRYVPLDTDSAVENLLGASVSEIFEDEGEEVFRNVESQVLDEMHSFVKMVIATGGGIVKRSSNWGKMHTGIVVWLDMDPEGLMTRMMKGQGEINKRPLLGGKDAKLRLTEILEERRPMYEQADVRIPVEEEDHVTDVTSKIIKSVVEFIDSNPPKWQEWKKKAQAEGVDWA
ncbi:unnamed protein product [Choristocarpus tenellus]